MRKTINGNTNMYYVLTDHLGSIDAVVSAVSGTLPAVEYYSFDAWGNRRNPNDWTQSDTRTTFITDRGYTGHEMLDAFGLINANGRIYEPATGRFLSPDDFVQSPDFSQSFNRYAYCWNNPMNLTDPDGEWVQFVIGAIVGGIQGYSIGHQAGLEGWGLFWSTIGGAAVGSVSAGIGTSIAASSGMVAAGMVGGAISGFGMSVISGVTNNQSLNTILSNSLIGAIGGSFMGGLGGSVSGAIGGRGGAFFGGATIGAISSVLSGESGGNVLKKSIIGGITSYGLYEVNGLIGYQQYKNSGETFNGNILSYRQFMGMGADYQRSAFWRREFGGVLCEGGRYVHRYKEHPLVNKDGRTEVFWDWGNFPADAWATSHSHYGKPGSNAPDGGVFVRYQSTKDMKFDYNRGLAGFVVNRFDASFHSFESHAKLLPFDPAILRYTLPYFYY